MPPREFDSFSIPVVSRHCVLFCFVFKLQTEVFEIKIVSHYSSLYQRVPHVTNNDYVRIKVMSLALELGKSNMPSGGESNESATTFRIYIHISLPYLFACYRRLQPHLSPLPAHLQISNSNK